MSIRSSAKKSEPPTTLGKAMLKLTLPYVALLATVNNADEKWKTQDVWEVSMSHSSDPEFSFDNTNPPSFATRYVDAFEVCSQFLELRSPEEALTFFQRFGPFELLPQLSDDVFRVLSDLPNTRKNRKIALLATSASKPRRAGPIRWSRVQRIQSEFKAARMCSRIDFDEPIQRFVFQPLQGVELKFRGPEVFEVVPIKDKPEKRIKPEYYDDDPEVEVSDVEGERVLSLKEGSALPDAAIVNCEDVITAVRASIFLRRMNGFVWRRCKRRGCDKVFEVSSNRDRKIHHSPECAHLEAVNAYNERQKRNRKRKTKRKRRK